MSPFQEIIQTVWSRKKRNRLTFLTGAGISIESGLPSYRGTNGIWVEGSKFHKPEELGTLQYFNSNPEVVWNYVLQRKKLIDQALPNKCHQDLVLIESLIGDRFHLITQNVDGLHLKAGSSRVYEIHGNYEIIRCTNCKRRISFPDIQSINDESIKCSECGSWMRPNVLWFDEDYDEKNYHYLSSLRVAKESGALFLIGTSATTNLPKVIAKTVLDQGGYVIEMNIADSELTTSFQNKKRFIQINGDCKSILPSILDILKKCIPPEV